MEGAFRQWFENVAFWVSWKQLVTVKTNEHICFNTDIFMPWKDLGDFWVLLGIFEH